MENKELRVNTLTVQEAVERLRAVGLKMSAETLRKGIEQNVFPWADCIQCESSPKYLVYGSLMERWLSERAM